MQITLDYPPSANRYWRNYQGRVVRSQEAIDYKYYVSLICATAGWQPLEGDVRIDLIFYRPRKRGDLDNRIKILLDALQGYAFQDDEQVAELRAVRYDDKSHSPCVIVDVMGLVE